MGTTELTETHTDVYARRPVWTHSLLCEAIGIHDMCRNVGERPLMAGKRRYDVSYCSNPLWKKSVWDGKAGRGCEDQTELPRTHTHAHTHRPVWWILIKLSLVLDVIRRHSFLKDFSFNISQRLALFPLRKSIDLRLKMTFFEHLQWEM